MLSMRKMSLVLVVALAAFGLAPRSSNAAPVLNQHVAGTLDGTLGGVALGGPTAFSYDAVFDAGVNQFAPGNGIGIGIYSILSMSITIAGLGTYAAITGPDLNVLLADPSGLGFFGSGLATAGLTFGFYGTFGTSTDPAFSAEAVTTTDFSGYSGTATSPFAFGLVGVTGGLEIDSIEVTVASISAVPEPATWLLVVPALMFCVRSVGSRRKLTPLPA